MESGSERLNDQSTNDHLDLGYVSGVRFGFLFRTGLYPKMAKCQHQSAVDGKSLGNIHTIEW